ncbi:hypothetical protein [Oerskovia enterophila]|uniref:Uncharacterized protein n=1 Tax=Oerskovia enterophila TaxID=43678 RepID=A0A163Q8D9_9CELL|nr:hypothetical protein [Oerskovia enterophila]KZM33893.1 hypothetical protein OJAG_33770 [Oerskovia enterophila]OCI32555.1 hypothetical protein OERS_07390 [Oerskovia enterophila]
MASNTSLTGVALVLALALAVGGCAVDGQVTPGASESTGTVPTEAPPTETTTDPPEIDPTTPAPTTPAESGKPVVGGVGVLISNASWAAETGVTVRGYADTIDAAATCTLDLSKAGTTRNVTSEALEGPTTMSCGELIVGSDALSSGDWTAVLSYKSTTAWGSSAPVVVTVP